MISIKNPDQIAKMRTAGALLYEVLQKLREAVKPGMTTAALDVYAEQLIRKNHAIPSFLHYNGYPATLCTSIDDQIVHGIPSESQVLKEGSILSIDCGVILDGWQSDSALTVPVGEITPDKQKLIRVTEECFFEGARQAVNGNRLGDIGAAVQKHAENHGYGVVRELVGHGIGTSMHEPPEVPNFVDKRHGRGPRLYPGMTIAIEPMITLGTADVVVLKDGWTVVTRDAKPAAHYENTVAITANGKPEILTL